MMDGVLDVQLDGSKAMPRNVALKANAERPTSVSRSPFRRQLLHELCPSGIHGALIAFALFGRRLLCGHPTDAGEDPPLQPRRGAAWAQEHGNSPNAVLVHIHRALEQAHQHIKETVVGASPHGVELQSVADGEHVRPLPHKAMVF